MTVSVMLHQLTSSNGISQTRWIINTPSFQNNNIVKIRIVEWGDMYCFDKWEFLPNKDRGDCLVILHRYNITLNSGVTVWVQPCEKNTTSGWLMTPVNEELTLVERSLYVEDFAFHRTVLDEVWSLRETTSEQKGVGVCVAMVSEYYQINIRKTNMI